MLSGGQGLFKDDAYSKIGCIKYVMSFNSMVYFLSVPKKFTVTITVPQAPLGCHLYLQAAMAKRFFPQFFEGSAYSVEMPNYADELCSTKNSSCTLNLLLWGKTIL